MDKRCALLPGSGEVFGNAYGWKPRPLLATGIVDAGARTIDKMKPAGKAKPGGLPGTKQKAFIFGGISEYRCRVRSIDRIRTISPPFSDHRERSRMDATSIWLHNINIDRTLDRLGTYIDPRKRASLLKFLIEELDQLDAGLDQLERTSRRVREGKARISRTLVIIEGLIACSLMDQETLPRALGVLSAMRESQLLIEQRYRLMLSQSSSPLQER